MTKDILESNEKRCKDNGKERTVDGNAQKVTDLLNLGASQTKRTEIPKDKVVVCAAGLQLVSILDELIRQSARVFDDLLRVGLPRRLGRLEKSSRNASNSLQASVSILT